MRYRRNSNWGIILVGGLFAQRMPEFTSAATVIENAHIPWDEIGWMCIMRQCQIQLMAIFFPDSARNKGLSRTPSSRGDCSPLVIAKPHLFVVSRPLCALGHYDLPLPRHRVCSGIKGDDPGWRACLHENDRLHSCRQAAPRDDHRLLCPFSSKNLLNPNPPSCVFITQHSSTMRPYVRRIASLSKGL
jgi:hypothetical protein